MTKEKFRSDLFAGLTNAVIVLPQGVAYALIAGMPPEYGLYAAIFPAIIAALFGSSYHLISGPTAALSIVVFTTLSPLATPGTADFVALALTLTLLAGLFQLILAFARLGVLVNFVSHSVVIGFTAGAAVIIATSQMNNLLGVEVAHKDSFIGTWIDLYYALPNTSLHALLVGLSTLFTCLIIKRFFPKWPNMLFGMIVGSLCVIALGTPEDVALVGAIPATLPIVQMPNISMDHIYELAPGAIAIGLLGLVEAVSIARAIATHSHQRISGNQEFMGQALSNVFGSFMSSYASSGSFTRTGVNYTSGARTPLSAIIAALSLAVIMLLFSNLTAYVPIPSMAAILLLVSYNLIDFHHIRAIINAGRAETTVLTVTFVATLLMPMEFAIYIGVMLSLTLYLKRTSKPRVVSIQPEQETDEPIFISVPDDSDTGCPQLRVVRIEGAVFFGAVNYVQDFLLKIREPNVLIVGNGMNFIDLAGAEMLAYEAQRRRTQGGVLYFTNLKQPVIDVLNKNNYLQRIGDANIFGSKGIAVREVFLRLDPKQCETCDRRIFHECRGESGQLISTVKFAPFIKQPSTP